MKFVKKHYEKIILGVVLALLGAAAFYLPFALNQEKQGLDVVTNKQAQGKAVVPLNLTTNEALIAQLKEARPLELPERHNIFNPVTWKETPDHKLLKMDSDDKEGPGALKIMDIRPLGMVISIDRITPAGFFIGVVKESVTPPKTSKYATLNQKVEIGKNESFTIREVKGPAEDPTEMVLDLELRARKETITISKAKPYKRVEGYAVDLYYPPENRKFPKTLVNHTVSFNDENYIIIDIKQNEVTIKAYSNQKTTTKKWNPTP